MALPNPNYPDATWDGNEQSTARDDPGNDEVMNGADYNEGSSEIVAIETDLRAAMADASDASMAAAIARINAALGGGGDVPDGLTDFWSSNTFRVSYDFAIDGGGYEVHWGNGYAPVGSKISITRSFLYVSQTLTASGPGSSTIFLVSDDGGAAKMLAAVALPAGVGWYDGTATGAAAAFTAPIEAATKMEFWLLAPFGYEITGGAFHLFGKYAIVE